MAAHLYHLHTGKHVGDFTNSKTGVVDKNHVFTPGETVYNDKVDLAASFPEKFTYLGQRPGAGNVPTTPESLDAQIKALQDQKAAMEKEKARAEAAAGLAAAGGNTTTTRKAIAEMTDAELKAFCEEEEVDLKGFKPSAPGNAKKTHDEKVAYVQAQVGGGK